MAGFYEKVKSTIDKLAADIAASLSVQLVELDDTVNVDEKLASDLDLIVYQMVGMDENPIDPIWDLTFEMGAKTTTDAANYDMANMLDVIRSYIGKGTSILVKDYSEVSAPTTSDGFIFFTDTAVDPQAFDGASGVRMLSVQSKAVRNL